MSHSTTAAPRGRVRLGTQGWNYPAWVGPFFPTGTRPAEFLATYARAFDTVEVDSTFYATPAASTVRGWASRVPDGFTFALKLPQAITHERRLRDAGDACAEFFDRARELGPRLGPVLVQLPPDFHPREYPSLAAFVPTLPADVQVAVEFRHPGWAHDRVLALLADHGVAFALTDARWFERATMLALAERPTARFAYVRWLGPDRTITDFSRTQVDRSAEIAAWSSTLVGLAAAGLDVYGYTNNHFAGHSPATTRELQSLLGQRPVDPASLGEQISLF